MNAQHPTTEQDALLTGSQLAIAAGRPSMAISRAIARGVINPDFRAGSMSLFRRSRLAELRAVLASQSR